MQALHDVIKAGYFRYIGMSSCYAQHCYYVITFCFVWLIHIYSIVHAMQINYWSLLHMQLIEVL